jgi:four helix bundle protein
MAVTAERKRYDLDERTFKFAEQVIPFARLLPRDPATAELIRQVVRSSGSVGANYVEASESLGRKDFLMRARICRKEAKETVYWLRLLKGIRPQLDEQRCSLIQEATELTRIFGAIVSRGETRNDAP